MVKLIMYNAVNYVVSTRIDMTRWLKVGRGKLALKLGDRSFLFKGVREGGAVPRAPDGVDGIFGRGPSGVGLTELSDEAVGGAETGVVL